ncbi:MAG: XRE family transcriptional regulator, partial [Sphingobacteriales bacterium]
MKMSKKLKVLAGITRIRVKLGWSQQQLACYLGISKSMISMIENGNRQIPPAAFLRLCELERLFNTRPELLGKGGAMPVFQESADEKFIRQGREEINRLRL